MFGDQTVDVFLHRIPPLQDRLNLTPIDPLPEPLDECGFVQRQHALP